MEAIERLTQRIQGNFNRRKEWDAVLSCAVKASESRLGEVRRSIQSLNSVTDVDQLLADEEWESLNLEETQLMKTIHGLGWLRDLKDHQ